MKWKKHDCLVHVMTMDREKYIFPLTGSETQVSIDPISIDIMIYAHIHFVDNSKKTTIATYTH